MKPKLSIVTGTLNRQYSFGRLYRSIDEHTNVPWEMIVSNASDRPYDIRFPENVTMIEERPRLGCVKGYNRAFNKAKGEYTIWLNDDCEVLPGYAEEAIKFMEANPQIGLGALHYSEAGSAFHVNSAWGAIYANFGIIRTQLGRELGFFDESLTMYGCDNSITFRVLLAGMGVTDIPESKVIHHSEKDNHRVENQQARMQDNETLAKIYMPLRDRWLRTFQRYHVLKNYEVWPHGQRPAGTVAS